MILWIGVFKILQGLKCAQKCHIQMAFQMKSPKSLKILQSKGKKCFGIFKFRMSLILNITKMAPFEYQ